MNNQPSLLAKSKRKGVEVTLQNHLYDVEKAARQVFNLDKRWGKNWCRFFKIIERKEQERFLQHLRIGALFHDIGKANEEFQDLVSGKSGFKQTLRHEHLSALILHLSEVREWLKQNNDLDLDVITSAVLSHHIKASDKGDWEWGQPKGKPTLRLFYSHAELNAVFDEIREAAGLPNQLRLENNLWLEKSPWLECKDEGFNTARDFRRAIKKDDKRRNFLLAVKAGLIVADAVASGLVREGHLIDDWINEKAHSETIKKNEVADKIIKPRGDKIFKCDKHDWSDFQVKSATLGKRALLLAACGSGKTIAAWKWAEAQSLENKIGKVIFLYPTRGTATEGFRDYVGYAPEAEAGLLHGTSKYELDAILENPTDATQGKNFETEARLFALGFWGKKYFSATVDQFLSFLEHNYSSLCLLPVLADSAVIIDEIHSFDRRMFENLICFLKNFDVPVLCMTATLTKSRRENLERGIEGLRVYPSKEEFEELADLKKAEEHKRYNLEIINDGVKDFANESEAVKIAVAAYRERKRVLWVVNTVKRCQSIAKKLEKELQAKPLVYHSRFRLKDRQKRHTETVDAFKQTSEAKIAVTTQVCEMSLDLDADVLITEIAPITSLVQRFGRANRKIDGKAKDFRARLVAYMPEKDKPYSQKDDLDTALDFLKDLRSENNGKDISQRLLAEKLEKHANKERHDEGDFAPFLSSGYFAVPGNFREIDAFTNPCILSDDLDEVKKCLDENKPIDAFVIGVPKQFILKDFEKPAWLPKYLGTADAKFYDADFGFVTDLENENE